MRRAAGVVAAVALLVGACGQGAAPSSPEASPAPAPTSAPGPEAPAVPGIAAEAVRLRTDEAVGGRVQVRVTNTGTAPFTVTSVVIESPGSAPLPPTAVSATYAPRQTIDLPTPVGTAVCRAEPEPAVARLTLTRPDGAVEELRVPLTGDALARVHREECAVAALAEVVDVSLADLAPDGQHLTGTVVLTRRSGNEPVEVTALARSVLVDPVLTDELPVVLPPDEAELRLPVTFRLASCDPHVLAETKKPFVFPLTVVVGERAGVPVDLPVDDGQRAMLQELVDRVC
jgi:hypothetical protein